jgi:hypothetical protein
MDLEKESLKDILGRVDCVIRLLNANYLIEEGCQLKAIFEKCDGKLTEYSRLGDIQLRPGVWELLVRISLSAERIGGKPDILAALDCLKHFEAKRWVN